MISAPTRQTEPPALELRSLSRSFGPVRAVRDVSFSVQQGEVIGLGGENGAGKSVLLNLISGTDRPDAGEVLVRGEPVSYKSYYDAARNGVYRVFQELALIPNLPVWENLFLGHERLFAPFGLVGRRKAIHMAREVFERLGHGWIDVEAPIRDYPFATRQIIEIVKAFALGEILGWSHPIILLDEPTAAASSEEVDFLRGMVEAVRPQSAVIFVSHRLSELLAWSDRVVVLRDGEIVGEGSSRELSEESLHYMMVGRERAHAFYREVRQRQPDPAVTLEARHYGDGVKFRDVNLSVHRGEIVGIAGVLGSGKSELGRTFFGARPACEGQLYYRGELVQGPSIRSMALAGMGYVSPERKEDGILDTFSVTQNITFARITIRGGHVVSPKGEAAEGRTYIQRLRIKTASPDAPILSLSGGNQQKVIVARWIATRVEMLILDNPTRGVDAGAKEEIYDLMRDLADQGVGILLISDDLLEVIGLSNRIVVMKAGEITSEVEAPPEAKPSETQLIAHMV